MLHYGTFTFQRGKNFSQNIYPLRRFSAKQKITFNQKKRLLETQRTLISLHQTFQKQQNLHSNYHKNKSLFQTSPYRFLHKKILS